jgi:hypothetical protein
LVTDHVPKKNKKTVTPKPAKPMPSGSAGLPRKGRARGPARPGAAVDFKLSREYHLEDEVEKYLKAHFDELKTGGHLLGTQIILGEGKRMDMLAIERTGQLCVVELKRDLAVREVFAQALDYGRLISGSLRADLDELCRKVHKQSLADFYQDHFKRALPKKPPLYPRLIIIAGDFDEDLIQSAILLQNHHFKLNLIRYELLPPDHRQRFRFTPVKVAADALRVREKMPGQVARIRFSETGDHTWEMCRTGHCLFATAATAAEFRRWLGNGPLHVLVYLDYHGYVASGIIAPEIEARHDLWAGDVIRLPVDWEYALEARHAIFSNDIQQPPGMKQPMLDLTGQPWLLTPDEAGQWARLLGRLKFRDQKAK